MVKFPGFLAVYEEGLDQKAEDDDENLLPLMRKGDCPAKIGVDANQHFTQPPPRFSEASLVKRLEELGIGRPSTYASTIAILRRIFHQASETPAGLILPGDQRTGSVVRA